MLIQMITLVIIMFIIVCFMAVLMVEIIHTTGENTKRRNQARAELRAAKNLRYSHNIKKRY